MATTLPDNVDQGRRGSGKNVRISFTSPRPSLTPRTSRGEGRIFGVALEQLPMMQGAYAYPAVVQGMLAHVAEGLDRPNLFPHECKSSELARIVRAYDLDADVNLDKESTPALTSSVLLYFLQTLPTPLVATDVASALYEQQLVLMPLDERLALLRRHLACLPELHYQTLFHIVELCYDVMVVEDRILDDPEETLLDFLRDTDSARPSMFSAAGRKESMLDFIRETEPERSLSDSSRSGRREKQRSGPPQAHEMVEVALSHGDSLGPALFHAFDEPKKSIAQQVTAVLVAQFIPLFMEKRDELRDAELHAVPGEALTDDLLAWLARDSLGLLLSKGKPEGVNGAYCVEYGCEWTAAHMMNQYRRACLAAQLLAALSNTHGRTGSSTAPTGLSFSMPALHQSGKRLDRIVSSPSLHAERRGITLSPRGDEQSLPGHTFRSAAVKREEEMKRRISWSHLGEQRSKKASKHKSALAVAARARSPTLPHRPTQSSHSEGADAQHTMSTSASTSPRRRTRDKDEALATPRSEGSSDSARALSDDDVRRQGSNVGDRVSEGSERGKHHKHKRDKTPRSDKSDKGKRERRKTKRRDELRDAKEPDARSRSHRSSSATSDE